MLSENRATNIFVFVLAAIALLGFGVWSAGRHEYTGTIVKVQRVYDGKYVRGSHYYNKVTVQTATKRRTFSDSINTLIGKDQPLDPKANAKQRYKITTTGLPGDTDAIQNIVKLTKIK